MKETLEQRSRIMRAVKDRDTAPETDRAALGP